MSKLLYRNRENYFTFNIFLFVISLGFAFVYHYFNPIETQLIAKAVALSVIFVNLPDIIRLWFKGTYHYLIEPIVLLFFVALGFLYRIPDTLIFTGAGICILVKALFFIEYIKSINNRFFRISIFVLSTLATASLLATMLYFGGNLSPFFQERIAAGIGHLDTIWHISIATFLSEYGTPSLGLHGIVPMQYHYGSHIIFAGITSLAGIMHFEFYNLYYYIIFIPFFIKGLYLFTQKMCEFLDVKLPILFFVAGFMFMHIVLQISIANNPVQPFASESHGVSISFSFYFIAALLSVFNKKHIKPFDYTVMFLIASVGVGILLITKISIGFLFFVFVAYMMFRVFSWKSKAFLSYAIAGGLIVFILYAIRSGGNRPLPEAIVNAISKPEVFIWPILIVVFFFLRNFLWEIRKVFLYATSVILLILILYVSLGDAPFSLSVFNSLDRLEIFFWPFFFIVFIIIKEKLFINFNSKIVELYESKKYLLLEVFIVVSLASTIPGFVMLTDTFDIFYFTSYQVYLGLGVFFAYFLSVLPEKYLNKDFFDKAKLSSKMLVLIAFLIYGLSFTTLGFGYFHKSKVEYAKVFETSRMNPGLLNLAYHLPKQDFDKSTVFFLADREFASHMVNYFKMTALTGRPQLYSFPKDNVPGLRYGLAAYRHIEMPEEFTEELLINEARRLGFRNIIVVNKDFKLEHIRVD